MKSFKDLKVQINKEMKTSIATAVVELPSNKAKATIRPLKTKDAREFLKALEKQDEVLVGEAFDKMLMASVDTINGDPVDVENMNLKDRVFLLIKIRELSSANKTVKITHVCPISSKVYNDIPVDISTFTVKYPEQPLTMVLNPVENIRLTIGQVTRKNEKDIQKWMASKDKKTSTVDLRYCTYAALIKSIEMKNSETEEWEKVSDMTFDNYVEFVVDTLREVDLKALDEFMKSLDYGIKMTFHFKSDAADYENDHEEANLLSFFII